MDMWRVLRSYPFFLLGLLTYVMFRGVEALPEEAHDNPLAMAAISVTRTMIIPMYVGWLLVTILSIRLLGPDPGIGVRQVIRFVQIMVGFAPYVVGDALLRWRRSLIARPAA